MRASPAQSARRFAVPPPPKRLIDRPRILNRLDCVLGASLTSMSGPAGAGKSVAAAQWCRERCPLPVAWTTIEEADADLFVERLLEALHSITGAMTSGVDDAHDGEIGEDAVERLYAAVAGTPECVVVVDSARTLMPTSAIADVAAALERAPACGVRVLCIGRLPHHPALAPMRLRGTVAQLDAADLLLDADEVASVVEAHSNGAVERRTAVELTERLDGWMAGVVFVGISRASPDVETDAMIAAAWPAISSYLASEVLAPLPEPLRDFLVETACVSELSAPLCTLLTGRPDSHHLLRSLGQFGLPFTHGSSGIESLRLPGMLRTALDEQAIHDDPEARSSRLRRAIEWYGEQDMPLDVAECRVRLGDWDGVAETVVTHIRSILDSQEFGRVAALVARAPARVLAEDDVRILGLAALLLWEGRIAAMYDLLGAFQRLFRPGTRATADILRAGVTSWVDDPTAPLTAAESAIAAFEAIDTDDRMGDLRMEPVALVALARASALLASAYAGQWARGRPHFVEAPADLRIELPQIHHLRVHGARATFLALGGEVDGAVREARIAEAAANELGHTTHRMAADAYWALGEALRLRASFDEVDALVTRVLELTALNGRRNLASAALATRAHLLVDTARSDKAIELLAAHRPRDHRLPHTIAGMMAAAEARALCTVGAPYRALDVLRAAPMTSMAAAATMSAMLGIGDLSGARRLVDDWPAEETVASEVRRSLAAASVHDASGGSRVAQKWLRSALKVAAGHGLVQPFLEGGPTVRRLLGRIKVGDKDAVMQSIVEIIHRRLDVTQSSAPRFTSREAAVMMLLERRMSLPAIAKEMFVSVNTIKYHVKAIYRKLGVGSRDEAIAAWHRASGATPDS